MHATWSFVGGELQSLKMFENTTLNRIFRPKRKREKEEVIVIWKQVRIEELLGFYSLQYNIRGAVARRLDVIRMGQMGNATKL